MTIEESRDRENWVDEKYKEGLHPTIIFKDRTDDKLPNRDDRRCE